MDIVSYSMKPYDTIYNWKKRGVKGDYKKLYDIYINTTNCDICKVKLISGIRGNNKKCLDHDHITGEFRNILCNTCNTIKRQDKFKTNTSGYTNISYSKNNNAWNYRKWDTNHKVCRYFKSKIDCICYKFIMLLKHKST